MSELPREELQDSAESSRGPVSESGTKQILRIAALVVLGFALLPTPEHDFPHTVFPFLYLFWLIFFSPVVYGETVGIRTVGRELGVRFVPLAFFIYAIVHFPKAPMFDGLAATCGRGEWPYIDEFTRGCRVIVVLLLTHLTWVALRRADSPRKLGENLALLMGFMAVLAGCIMATGGLRVKDARGNTFPGKIVRVEGIDLQGGPLPDSLKRMACTSRTGDHLVVFDFEFKQSGRTRLERRWDGLYFREKRWADMLVNANPAGSAREVYVWDSPSGEMLRLQYAKPPDYNESEGRFGNRDWNPFGPAPTETPSQPSATASPRARDPALH